jgi:hypothetical protein
MGLSPPKTVLHVGWAMTNEQVIAGLRIPAVVAASGELAGPPELGGVLEFLGHAQVALGKPSLSAALTVGGAILGVVGQVRPSGGDDSAECCRTLQRDREVAVECTREYGVAELGHLTRSRGFSDACDGGRHFGDAVTGREQPGCVNAVAMDPGAKQIQRPQGTGQRVRTCVAPQLGDLVDADVVSERHEPLGALGVGVIGATPGLKQRGSSRVRGCDPVGGIWIARQIRQTRQQQRPPWLLVVVALPCAHTTILYRIGKSHEARVA